MYRYISFSDGSSNGKTPDADDEELIPDNDLNIQAEIENDDNGGEETEETEEGQVKDPVLDPDAVKKISPALQEI